MIELPFVLNLFLVFLSPEFTFLHYYSCIYGLASRHMTYDTNFPIILLDVTAAGLFEKLL